VSTTIPIEAGKCPQCGNTVYQGMRHDCPTHVAMTGAAGGTPRTDVHLLDAIHFHDGISHHFSAVNAEFARTLEHENAELRAALASRQPVSQGGGWRDIASAPKDGTPVLGFMPTYYQGKGGQSVIIFLQGHWMDNRAWKVSPTKWQPLPSPPEAEGEA
jgi:hypothetical protein